ncbi:hypothetical protein OP10G_1168 [Fimbriimonas ginsengisoli Gsoil 348]|uniref:Glycosyl hydrolase n=2 Tax=Fimbriimonas ginsengisoli TaxID=1005039 RepID=A0A068NM41_FIMGI|nr:hypothetical protein OP10G_1168 [Fimbriimonas ginsengisoli Gsoil 348]
MASAGGGVWKSTDGGANWVAKGDKFASLAVACLAMDPKNPGILYAGTGEGYYNSDAQRGVGIYKSTDGGENWSLIQGSTSMGDVNKIAISPSNSSVMLASTQSYSKGGIWRSTDAGASWTRVRAGETGFTVAFIAGEPSKAVASNLYLENGVYYLSALYSTDSGATWNASAGPLNKVVQDRVELAPAPSDSSLVYAMMSDGKAYKSTNGGASYSVVTTGGKTDSNWYADGIWVDPTDPNFIVASGTYVYKSTNGGQSFTRISNGYIQTENVHPDDHLIVAIPGYSASNRVVYVCSDGGVYRATNIATASVNGGWARLDKTARVTQYYSVAGDGPTGFIVGGTQDNGTLSLYPGSDAATLTYGGDGGYVAVDPTNPQYNYGEYIFLQIYRNTTAGNPGSSNEMISGLTDAGGNANFIAPFILDPNRPQVLLAGGISLWRCANAKAAGPTWSAIKSPISNSVPISAIAVAPGNSDLIWVGYNDGRLYKTSNGTAASPTWTAVDDNSAANPLPNRYITRILVDPDNANKAYVALGGYTISNLWVTANAGSTWTVRSGNLPQAPIRAIARKPGSPDTLYVGTEVGIFSSADGGGTWSTTSDAPSNVAIDDLQYLNNSTTLVAASHGRGLWVLKTAESALKSLTLDKTTVVGGQSATATVTSSKAAPAGGLSVALSSADAAVTVPASVTIAAGATTATFTVNTKSVTANKTVRLTAAAGGGSVFADLAVLSSPLSGITVAPAEVGAGYIATGTVTLGSPAPAGGSAVSLKSSGAAATVDATVTVPAGATKATFPVRAQNVSVATNVTITATLGTGSATAPLKVFPVQLSTVTVSPGAIPGGVVAGAPSLTATLSAKVPTEVKVTLSSNNAAVASVPATITIPANTLSASATVTTKPVTVNTSVTFTAMAGSSTKTASLIVTAPTLTTLALSKPSVTGGSGEELKATVTLSGPAPSAGVTVALKSSNSVIATPVNVKVLAGATSAVATLTHTRVSATTSVTITATLGANSRTAIEMVNTYTLKSVAMNPTSVVGGSSAVGTVTLPANAPAGGIVVTLSSSSTVVKVPVSVTVPAGASTATFTATTKVVTAATTVTLTAKVGSSTQTATLTVKH